MKILKVKHITKKNSDGETKQDKLHVEYTKECEKKPGCEDEFSTTYNERATDSLYRALQALRIDLEAICELPEGYGDRITVKGVSLSYSSAGKRGCVITGQMELFGSVCPLNLNTPHKVEAFDDEEDKNNNHKNLLDPATIMRLNSFLAEVAKYIGGERAQVDMMEELDATLPGQVEQEEDEKEPAEVNA